MPDNNESWMVPTEKQKKSEKKNFFWGVLILGILGAWMSGVPWGEIGLVSLVAAFSFWIGSI